jgi:hypothetical protein
VYVRKGLSPFPMWDPCKMRVGAETPQLWSMFLTFPERTSGIDPQVHTAVAHSLSFSWPTFHFSFVLHKLPDSRAGLRVCLGAQQSTNDKIKRHIPCSVAAYISRKCHCLIQYHVRPSVITNCWKFPNVHACSYLRPLACALPQK